VGGVESPILPSDLPTGLAAGLCAWFEFPIISHPVPSRASYLLLLLFFGSGCAALIYEIVWFQLLELVIGSTGVSLGVLLGTFMGGMCLGSLLLPRFISPTWHPLRVYAVLEAAIGVFGVLVLFGVPIAGRLYAASVAPGLSGLLLRGLTCAALLLPPTIMMGATLPAVARWIRATREGVSWLGFFYASNIVGAVFGSLLAGFYLLRVYDLETGTFVAAALNAAVAIIGWALSAVVPNSPRVEATFKPDAGAPQRATTVYLVIALSGLSALGAEVVWTRLLSLMLGPTTYTFSIILAVILIGLGIGSSAGAWLARSVQRPRLVLGLAQFLLPVAIAWTAAMVTRSLPYWPIDPRLSQEAWIDFQMDFVRCLWAVFPATVLWGASFPLALAAIASPDHDPGRLVGRVYAANTLGAIGGALLFSVVLIPAVGTQQSQRILIACAVVAGLIALVPEMALSTKHTVRRLPVALALASAVAVLLVTSIGPVPPLLIAYGRMVPTIRPDHLPDFLYLGEGMNASVAVSQFPLRGAPRRFHVNGKVEASTEPGDMRLQRLLGHLPALVHGKPRSVLVVGFGAGVTAGSFVLYPEIERIVICEIEPLIPANVARYFRKENYDVLNDPRVEIVYDDARHFILTTNEKFDVITSDPIHPWVKGAATLYTQEYVALAKAHLNPGGIMAEWVPLYENSIAGVKSLVATFFEVFPGASMWTHIVRDARGDDVVILGQPGPTQVDVEALEARFNGPEYARVKASLREIGINSTIQLFSGYSGQKAELAPWLADAQINRDRNLRLQYLAGIGKYSFEMEEIYRELDGLRRFPDSLFVASEAWKDDLRRALETSPAPQGRFH
jgi:spermidine synthase